jgi:hypothetical protein
MKVKQIDTYIKSTQSLLKANPSTTTISITYTHSKKDDDKIRSIIKFKTYDPKHGICYVFKTHKIKEFSKLCNALGPKGCNIQGKDEDGLSLLLSNVERNDIIKESTPVETSNIEAKPDTILKPASKKKKNKKKGKK